MWDSVPWFVGGGAEHSPEVARLLANAATANAQGIIEATDLRVRPYNVPGAGVIVGPGACVIRSAAAGGDQQSYIARNPDDDVVEIAPTTSAGPRSDLIVARIEDPFVLGERWDDPADPKVGPYVYTRVIPNVAAGTTRMPSGETGIPLARIDLAASTGTVDGGTKARIVDLRKVAQPRRERRIVTYSPNSTEYLTDTGGGDNRVHFPKVAELIDCPEWATQVKIAVTIGNILAEGNFTGHVRAEYGWNGVDPYIFTDFSGYHHFTATASSDRQTVIVGGEVFVPPAFRGKTHFIRTGSVGNLGEQGRMVADTWMTVLVDLEFVEVPE